MAIPTSNNTIQIQYVAGGPITTYNSNVLGISGFGTLAVQAIRNASDTFSLAWIGDTPGTYEIALFTAANYSMGFTQSGKVKITSITVDGMQISAKGTFSLDVTDDAGKEYQHVIGSFNVKK
ncbi:hypothetical protein [Mucilaginibacter pedocola]|uniref:hypothetical protein n=1 Tax=Mucilaginibacter pedocola TaxID=1792845 RepID=UPI0012DC2843|nr:hypothetical protein [Mucilaginibacter pedocola]